ncbi:MAG TPA: hypothetical protein VHG33_09025 [Woeseiaceae bacterium]|nr:hypothetical protein [Woeseiaceae bacterium]
MGIIGLAVAGNSLWRQARVDEDGGLSLATYWPLLLVAAGAVWLPAPQHAT